MSPRSIPKTSSPSRDGIFHLPDALARHSNNRVVVYARVSELTQVANGSLDRQKYGEYRAYKDMGLVVKASHGGQERGKLGEPRPTLLDAIDAARRHKAILSCADLSRFIRAKEFSRTKNWNVQATPEEIGQLLELADGVLFATRLHPNLSASELHSQATKRGKPGRPSGIDYKIGLALLNDHESGDSIAVIAKCHGVTKSTAQRFLAHYDRYDSPDDAFVKDWRKYGNVSYSRSDDDHPRKILW